MSNHTRTSQQEHARHYAKPKPERYSYQEFANDYSDDDILVNMLWKWQYGSGVVACKRCGKYAKHYRARKTTQFACGTCGNLITPLKNTPFYRSHVPLSMWLYAIYLCTIDERGGSAKELEQALGVQYKTAHTMLRKIRTLFAAETYHAYFHAGKKESY